MVLLGPSSQAQGPRKGPVSAERSKALVGLAACEECGRSEFGSVCYGVSGVLYMRLHTRIVGHKMSSARGGFYQTRLCPVRLRSPDSVEASGVAFEIQ